MSRIEDLERRLAKDPNSKIFAQLAEEYRKAGRLEDAINTCREGLQSHPNYFSARVALGRALLESNALEEASQEFEAVLAQVPDNILANKFLGRTYHELERYPDALAKYQIAHSLAPEDSELSSLISEVEAQIRQGLVSQPGPAPLAEYDDPTAFEFEGGENEPTFVEAEPYRPPVPPQPSFLAPQTGSQEAVFEFESSELTGAGIQEPPPVPPAPPSPTAASVPTEPSEVVYELEDREPVPPAPPPVPLVPPVPSPPEAPGEVIYTLDGSEAIEPDASPAGPPSSPGEVVYEFDDQIPVTGASRRPKNKFSRSKVTRPRRRKSGSFHRWQDDRPTRFAHLRSLMKLVQFKMDSSKASPRASYNGRSGRSEIPPASRSRRLSSRHWKFPPSLFFLRTPSLFLSSKAKRYRGQ